MSSVGRPNCHRASSVAISPSRLRGVVAYIEAHLAERIKLADLARVACSSPFHFCRSFRHAMGVSPHRYVTQQRIRRAQQMLRVSDAALDTIARDVGFNSRRQFAARFRDLTGSSPSAFRRTCAGTPTRATQRREET